MALPKSMGQPSASQSSISSLLCTYVLSPMEITHDSIALEAPVKQNLCGSTVLPDGKVVMVPYDYPAIVLFDPATKTPDEFGDFEGSYVHV